MNPAKAIIQRAKWLYGLCVRRDPFLLEVRRWFRDNGDQTLRLKYPLDARSLVIDVGGYVGDFANAIHGRYGCRVLVFEPVGEYYRYCVSRFAGNPKVEVFNYGLGSRNASLPIKLEGDGSSFLEGEVTSRGQNLAQLRRADKVLESMGVDRVDLMKINIEGGEYDLLDLLIDTNWIGRIQFLQIQFHNFVPKAAERRQAIRSKLARSHTQMWNYEFVWESWILKGADSPIRAGCGQGKV
ncbi:FkbM family methyltransferase [Sulfuricystis multivorans]|uniref:FkbM family methyltransferase n=1 Tax=Sulfuricystis multivorans TaxID=2211108 RepID=UPI000F81E751|nr:FkbM family methyltransferase [Sulfuricystis multivorans]